jgi:hypothetical protein
MAVFGRGGYNAPVDSGRGGYNAPVDAGRGGYNAPLKRGPDDDDEAEDGRGGYNWINPPHLTSCCRASHHFPQSTFQRDMVARPIFQHFKRASIDSPAFSTGVQRGRSIHSAYYFCCIFRRGEHSIAGVLDGISLAALGRRIFLFELHRVDLFLAALDGSSIVRTALGRLVFL